MSLYIWFKFRKSFLNIEHVFRFAINHLIVEHGYYTAQLKVQDVWLISNGTCMVILSNLSFYYSHLFF